MLTVTILDAAGSAPLHVMKIVSAVHAMASLFVALDRASRRWLPLTLLGTRVSAIGGFAAFNTFVTNSP